jgi:hypothetical protein
VDPLLLSAEEEVVTVGVVKKQLHMCESASREEHVEEVSRLRDTSSQRIRELGKRLEELEEEVGKLRGVCSECCSLGLGLEQSPLRDVSSFPQTEV